MTESVTIPGRPEPLDLEARGGRWWWRVGDCQGDELTRAEAIAQAERYLGARGLSEMRPTVRASLRQVRPSSRRPGAGPSVGTAYVTVGPIPGYQPTPMCCHGITAGNCAVCGATYCLHPGARKHDCFGDAR
ncbi:MAG TPA: hypothetical protein VMV51_12695 [Gemmatimonadaceae bacterium]|nr:hypothetical protein [Gemmatimonadaceae bacterium]